MARAATALRPVSSRARRMRRGFIYPVCLRCAGVAVVGVTPARFRSLSEQPASRGRGGGGPVLVELLHLPEHVRGAEQRLGGRVEMFVHFPGERARRAAT